MTKKRLRLAALLAVWLCLLIAAPATQAQYTCEYILNEQYLIVAEWSWYKDNCMGVQEDDQEEVEEESYRPPDVTCPHLPPRVVVSGYAKETQCQMVDEAHIGRMELIQRGFIDAVDVWHYVNGGLEVCFRNDGWLVFLDATYLQRKVMELQHYHRDGMTCGRIDRIGTVVLLRSAPTTAPVTQPAENALPILEAIPLSDCLIILVETLYLRAAPAGEIIGLVWLNSEVPAFEINGYWYKIEFEGRTGYISRFYRRVLSGGCG
ncbi:MAG: hypothetical protein OXG78_01770 [Chloroflexi bacterium]|nr:hypothetical protein [Chloroflexota bacterium]